MTPGLDSAQLEALVAALADRVTAELAAREVRLLTPTEVAARLGTRPSWVYEAVRAGRLEHVKLGKHVRFTPEQVAAAVAEATVSTRASGRRSGT